MSNVLLTNEGGIAVLTINRPEVRNALDDATRVELIAALDQVSRDNGIRALVLTGAGKSFSAGGDIRGMQERLKAAPGDVAINGWRRQQRTHHFIGALHDLAKPTIAAVNGAAAGLGCDLALACDFIVASKDAMMTMSYLQRGLIPDGGGMYFLPRRVGLVRAKELIFSARRVMPDEALSIGMIDRIAEPDKLVEDAVAWARELSQNAGPALALAKTILNETYEHSTADIFQMGSQAQGICYTTSEHQASVKAFLDKSTKKPAKNPDGEKGA